MLNECHLLWHTWLNWEKAGEPSGNAGTNTGRTCKPKTGSSPGWELSLPASFATRPPSPPPVCDQCRKQTGFVQPQWWSLLKTPVARSTEQLIFIARLPESTCQHWNNNKTKKPSALSHETCSRLPSSSSVVAHKGPLWFRWLSRFKQKIR